MQPTDLVDRMWRRGMAPDPCMTISEWADAHRHLSQRASAEPGRWRTDRVPYMRAIMDALSPSSPTERVVLQAGAQLAKTEVGLNFLAFVIDQAPGPVMLVQPTVEMAKRVSKQRVDGMIEATPRLRQKIRPARERDSGNTVLMKDFAGGTLVMTGANSAVGLRSMPVRYLFLDEADGFPPDAAGEGDPIHLAEARTSTFLRKKIFLCSTPTVDGASAIQDAYEASDQQVFEVPCQACHDRHELQFKDIVWSALDRAPENAAWVCPSCGGVTEHSAKPWMLANGAWRATADGPPRVEGFRLSGLCSPWVPWGTIAAEFVAAKANAERLKVWTNTRLGESFADVADAPDWRRLADRAEDYRPDTVPAGAVILTAGVDTQDDRLEVEIVAWGRGGESWSIAHRVLIGDPAQPDVWRKLDDLLATAFPTEAGGSLTIARVCIDSGGHRGADVMAWASRQPGERVMAIQGRDALQVPVGTPTQTDVNFRDGRRKRRGGRLWPVGVSLLKSRLYAWLAQDPPRGDEEKPRGLCHFPRYDDEYFKQLCAERKIKRKNRAGYIRFEWEKTRERNEVLDCRVYAMAAVETLRLDNWTEADWTEAEAATAAPEIPPASKPKPAVRRSSWLS